MNLDTTTPTNCNATIVVVLKSVGKMEEILQEAIKAYEQIFNGSPQVQVFAPGRVNLIGEHTDYNNGFVLPFALPFMTIVVGSITTNKASSRVHSCSMNETVSFEINQFLEKGVPKWANYIKGTIFQYLNDLPPNASFDAVIASNVPLGSGLSSSASLEVAFATFLENLYQLKSISGVTKALRCQAAEHTFGDTPCGIMDQYISAMGKKDNLLLIDCRSKEYQLVPFGDTDSGPVLIITNSMVKHSLSDGEYPIRVRQCQEAVRTLQSKYPHIQSLRDVKLSELEDMRSQFDPLIYNRALHCVTEDMRTLSTVEALRQNDFVTVGEHMTQSHRSLQHHYEVSCEELDFLVDTALKVPGVFGSRMTGGGFGGCTVTLVERDLVQALISQLKTKYYQKYQLNCICYECLPSSGAGVITDTRKEVKPIYCKQSEPANEQQRQGEFTPLDTLFPFLFGLAVVGLGVYFTTKRK